MIGYSNPVSNSSQTELEAPLSCLDLDTDSNILLFSGLEQLLTSPCIAKYNNDMSQQIRLEQECQIDTPSQQLSNNARISSFSFQSSYISSPESDKTKIQSTPLRKAFAPKQGHACCRLSSEQVAEMLKENMRFMEMNPTPGCFVRKNSPFSIIESSQLDEEYPHDIILVDCRWNFEYDGGHIHSATNYNDAQKMRNDLVVEKLLSLNPDTDIIFYCEFSQVRAVKMSDYLCKIDSIYNKDPQFSKIYVLDGGYSKFFEEYPELSTTGRYVTEKTREYELYVSKYSNFGKYDMNIPDIEVPIDEVE
ncbi:Rhodanese-like_domain-containing protein [Hexamita inflata]|uniref:protein-tyrosine-phosphatase n=1 Tax=Hexamita inflata TaxID=28002 RepID=A0AA86QG13_9EUKA|nr:Rhodanese-like domain-containing protein [Hexamita inflata]